MKLRHALLFVASATAAAGATLAHADSAQINVTATVVPACYFGTIPPWDFGNLEYGQATDATKTFHLPFHCSSGANYTVKINNGSAGSPMVGTLNNGGATKQLSYTLQWSDGAAGQGGNVDLPVTGTITASALSSAAPDTYSATITVDLTAN